MGSQNWQKDLNVGPSVAELDPPEGKAMMCVMDPSGDHRTIFDPNNDAEVEAAQATFKALKKKGYIAYRVNKEGDKAEIMSDFDAKAGKFIMAPPVAGG